MLGVYCKVFNTNIEYFNEQYIKLEVTPEKYNY